MTTELVIKDIRKNERTRGLYTNFSYNKKFYFADLSLTITFGNECMIFECENIDPEFEEIDWSGVYTKRDIPITEQSLKDCIKEFIEGL